MKYPKFLSKNGKIGVCAPSFGSVIEPYVSRLDNAIKTFNDLGHEVVLTEGVRKHFKASSDTGENRAKEFMELYLANDVDVIISEAGGEVEYEILRHLDMNLLSSVESKWFQGYSDNTVLVFLLTTLLDTASIYGVNFPEYGMNKWYKNVSDSYEILRGNLLKVSHLEEYEVESSKKEEGHYLDSYNLTETSPVLCLSGEKEFEVKGRVLVGCLDVLSNLVGTKYDHVKEFNEKYKDDGIIFFIESCELNVLAQQRALYQLKSAGWFDHVKGFVIGRPMVKDTLFDVDYKEANFKELEELNVPVLIDASFGHISPNFSVISGSIAKVSYKDGKCDIEYILE